MTKVNPLHQTVNILLMALIVLLLAGCRSKISTQAIKPINLTQLKEKKTGVAIFQIFVDLGKKNPCYFRQYAIARSKVSNSTYPYRDITYVVEPLKSPAVVELPAGKYYLVNFYCSRFDRYSTQTWFLKGNENKTKAGSQFKRAMASFTIKPGEVINAGSLYLKAVDVNRLSGTILDLDSHDLKWLKTHKPELYKRIKKQNMKRLHK